MTRIDLKHIHRFKDRHGRVRHYLRAPGQKGVALPGEPGSVEFMAAYGQAIAAMPAKALGEGKVIEGSLDDVAVRYYRSDAFKDLAESSQATYRRIVESMRATRGAKPFRLMNEATVRNLLAEKKGPAASNHRLRAIRALVKQAIADKIIRHDPTKEVEKRKWKTKGHTPWTEENIAQYRSRHPTGTVPRLAMELLLNMGNRRSDAVRVGKQHRTGNTHTLRQKKTGAVVTIPILPELEAELVHVPAGQMTYLETGGRARSVGGFYNMFVFWAGQAGLPAGLSPHGLRKAQGRRLAEAGCSAPEIMSILGHRTLAEAQRYIDDFNREKAAEAAMDRVAILNASRRTKSD